MTEKIEREDAIFALMRGLWGEVSSTLRAAYIDWNDKCIHLYFYYDGKISEEDRESAECVGTEVIANFSTHILEMDILRWDYPKPIPQENGELVYLRREL